ncbi:unnamed protein product [Adineta ricciae]|uniref:EF-hand domain-containing protein n=1 Tax=Adineta ricciae TaxID=249248 RepID=A0A814F3I0_ADIRI|nr:unnamed protein product [Adineta ricciae]
MFAEQQHIRSPPPLSYLDAASNSSENDSYAGGAFANSKKQGQYNVKRHERGSNPFRYLFRCIRKLWATQQTENINCEEDLSAYAKTTIRELTIYLAFVAILSIVVFGMVNPNMYTLTQGLKGVFVDARMTDESNNQTGPSFTELAHIDEFWQYMNDIAASGFFTETWYNDDNVSDYGYILYENRLLGAVQMRQKKVRNNSCIVANDFKHEIKFCMNSYAPAFEEKNSFGPCENLDAENCTVEAFKYSPSTSLFGFRTTGKVGEYDQGGYVHTFGSSQDEFKSQIAELKENLWITLGTRAIILDFTVYNANLNLFCQVQLLFEFPAVGGVVTSYKFRAVKLLRYVTIFDYFVLSCEILLALFVVYYTVEEMLEIKTMKSQYFGSVMNCLDLIVIILSYVCMAFNIYRQAQVNNLLDELLQTQNGQFSDFTFLCYWQYQFNNIISATIFLAWIKIFKYVSFNKTMTQLSQTLTKCARDISGFALMFFIIFFAFAQLGYLTFGIQIEGFRSFQYSVYTLFLVILGSFDFPALQQAHRILGPIFFLAYVFFVFFVLMNMFLAIINDTYMEVKAELQKKQSRFALTDFVKQGYTKMRDRLAAKHNRLADIRKVLSIADVNCDKVLDFEEWRTEMKSRGYAEEEIEQMFARYDTNGDRVLDEEEQRMLKQDLTRQNEAIVREMNQLNMTAVNGRVSVIRDDVGVRKSSTLPSQDSKAQNVTMDDYYDLDRRVDSMETSVTVLLSKIDTVVSKLDACDKPQSTATNHKQ